MNKTHGLTFWFGVGGACGYCFGQLTDEAHEVFDKMWQKGMSCYAEVTRLFFINSSNINT